MTAVMNGLKNKEAFRKANDALKKRIWDKLVRAGAAK